MRFRYLPIGGQLKPALDIVCIHNEQRLATRAVVDSGADFCVFDREIADQLGIILDLTAGINVRGIGGRITVYPGQLDVELRKDVLHLNAFFAPHLPINLLGRNNFFHHYIVTFDELEHTLTLKARRRALAPSYGALLAT